MSEEQFNKKTGARIKAFREAWKRTQKGIADELGISQPQVSKIEAGVLRITAYQLQLFNELVLKTERPHDGL